MRALPFKTTKFIKGLVNERQKWSFLSDFQYGFRAARRTADLLTVVSDTIALVFDNFEAM